MTYTEAIEKLEDCSKYFGMGTVLDEVIEFMKEKQREEISIDELLSEIDEMALTSGFVRKQND